jgi:hypothetical protein
MSTKTSPSRKILIVALLVPFLILISWIAYHELRTPQNQGEVLTRMIELQEEGRYDGAVKVVQHWMKDSRRDTSHDGLMYDQMAMVYIAKAYKRPSSREESVHRAELKLERSLSLFDQQNQNDLNLELFAIGGAYELLGDISDKDKCRLYEKAQGLVLRQLPLIKGDSYTAYGKTIPLDPVRAEVRKHLDAVKEKSSKAGCGVR